jgi:hypothetical protein
MTRNFKAIQRNRTGAKASMEGNHKALACVPQPDQPTAFPFQALLQARQILLINEGRLQ